MRLFFISLTFPLNHIRTDLDLIRILQYQHLAIELIRDHPHLVTVGELHLVDPPAIGSQPRRIVLSQLQVGVVVHFQFSPIP